MIFGVSLTITGIVAASMTQPTIFSVTAGCWPTAEPMPRSHMPCGQPKFSSMPSAPASAERLHELMPALPRVNHERSDDRAVGPALLDFGNLAEIGLHRTVADEFDVIEANHAHRADIQRRVARGGINDRIANGLPDHSAPAGLEGPVHLVSRIGRRAGGDPERVG